MDFIWVSEPTLCANRQRLPAAERHFVAQTGESGSVIPAGFTVMGLRPLVKAGGLPDPCGTEDKAVYSWQNLLAQNRFPAFNFFTAEAPHGIKTPAATLYP